MDELKTVNGRILGRLEVECQKTPKNAGCSLSITLGLPAPLSCTGRLAAFNIKKETVEIAHYIYRGC